LKLLVQPNDGATALLNALHRAQTSIEIAIFRFDHPEIEEALTTAVKRGVFVHALIAHVNGTSAEALRKLEMRLLSAGVTVARTDTGLARYHSKFLIIDRRELFVLAYNFTTQDIEKSRSFGLITKNRRLVQEAAKLFEADAKRQPYQAGSPNLVVSPLNARKQLSSFIKSAKSELVLYDPRVSDRAMLRLLRDRLDANVSVRIIGRVSGERNPIPVQQLARMRLHTRCIVRDRKAVFLGSQSLRELELDGRRELGIICRDRSVVAAILKIFEEDWAASAQAPVLSDTARPLAKVAKKIAKAISAELPSLAPVVDNVAKEINRNGAELKLDGEEVEETLRAAVKDAVKTAVQQVIEENMAVESTPGG
jgi:phospholipase D-like protein